MKKVNNRFCWSDIGYSFSIKGCKGDYCFFLYRQYRGVKNIEDKPVFLDEEGNPTVEMDNAWPIMKGNTTTDKQVKFEFLQGDDEYHLFDNLDEMNEFAFAFDRVKDAVTFALK